MKQFFSLSSWVDSHECVEIVAVHPHTRLVDIGKHLASHQKHRYVWPIIFAQIQSNTQDLSHYFVEKCGQSSRVSSHARAFAIVVLGVIYNNTFCSARVSIYCHIYESLSSTRECDDFSFCPAIGKYDFGVSYARQTLVLFCHRRHIKLVIFADSNPGVETRCIGRADLGWDVWPESDQEEGREERHSSVKQHANKRRGRSQIVVAGPQK